MHTKRLVLGIYLSKMYKITIDISINWSIPIQMYITSCNIAKNIDLIKRYIYIIGDICN